MQQLLKYFPNITSEQKSQFEALDALYNDWNSKINVISRNFQGFHWLSCFPMCISIWSIASAKK